MNRECLSMVSIIASRPPAGVVKLYLDLAQEWCQRFGVQIWSYCLMPNHVHLIAVPEKVESLRRTIGEIHQRYTRAINFRMRWRGHLWRGKFHSCPMDDEYLIATARYIELNPVKAKLVENPRDYRWSSARYHLGECDDPLLTTSPIKEYAPDWRGFLSSRDEDKRLENIRRAERSGRPVGSESFQDNL